MTQAMNKKINAYMMAAMMAVVFRQSWDRLPRMGLKWICNDVVQKGDSVYIDAVVTVSSDAVKSRSYLELTPSWNRLRKRGASFYFGERTYPPESI